MIVNKEQIPYIDQNGEETKRLVVSYVAKDGSIKFLDYPIPKSEMFNWYYAGRGANADPSWLSYDHKPVKKVPVEMINEYRMNELLCSFGAQADPIYEFNLPEMWFCDIETNVEDEFPEADTALQPVNTIALTKFPRTIVWGRKDLTEDEKKMIQHKISTHENKKVRGYKFEFRFFPNEADMLYDFFKFIAPIPCITGWNFLGYDWLYLYNRSVNKLGMDINFVSPTNKFYNFSINNLKFGKKSVMLPYHKIVFDYLMVYQKWDKSIKVKENNTLDFVADKTLGYKKIQHQLGFKDFYEQEYADYVFYNAVDTILVEQIHEKIRVANVWLALTAELKTELMMSFSTIKPTEVVLTNFCYEEHKVVPVKKREEGGKEDYEGAFVWPTQPGVYKMIGGLDFASLYPTTIRQFNISPETYKFTDRTGSYIPKPNEIKTTSGAVYDNSFKGLIPRVLTKYFNARKESKMHKKLCAAEHEALKEILDRRKASLS